MNNMPKYVLQKYFENRGINIPDLNPEQWAAHLNGPASAKFSQDFATKVIKYESGTGNTILYFCESQDYPAAIMIRFFIVDEDGQELLHIPNRKGEIPAQQLRVFNEFIVAGLDHCQAAKICGLSNATFET